MVLLVGNLDGMRSLRFEYLASQEGWFIFHFSLVISHLSEQQQLEDHAMTIVIGKMINEK